MKTLDIAPPQTLTCERCSRPVDAWPMERGGRCSPRSWVHCIRNDGEYEWSRVPREAGSSSLAFLACSLLALVPVSLVAVFVARLAGAVAGVMA